MLHSENFAIACKNKYPDLDKYESSFLETKLVKFDINFTDGSIYTCIMTRQQRDGVVHRSKWSKVIKSTGGLGYVKLKFGNGSALTHNKYGKGKCVGWVQGQFWRIQFENGELRDFLPAKLFKNISID